MSKVKCGDLLIINGLPFVVIDHWDKTDEHKYCLLDTNSFRTDVWMKDLDHLQTGSLIWCGVEDDGSDDMRIDAIIPKEQYEIDYKLKCRH